MNTFRTTEDCRNCCKREPQATTADWWELACACAIFLTLGSLGIFMLTNDWRWLIPSAAIGFIAMCGSHKAQEDRA